MSDDEPRIDWEGADGRRLAELRALFLERSQGGTPGATKDYWASERDLELYDLTLGQRIRWRWDAVLREGAASGARRSKEPARSVVDLGCGSGVASRAALEAGWVAPDARVVCVDRSGLARNFAAARLRAEGPRLDVVASDRLPDEAPELLLIGHLLLELDERDLDALLPRVRAARTVVWVEPGTRAAGQRLVELRDTLAPDVHAVAPCPHHASCGLRTEDHVSDWCHHFPEPPPEAFTESLPGRTARELGLDLRSLATSYLVLESDAQTREAGIGRVLGRPRIEKGRARIDLCTADGVDRVDLSKRDDARLWRAWKRPGRERLLYRVEVDGHRLRRAEAVDGATTDEG